MSTDIEIIDAHFHQWDPANTPHALRPLAKLLGWNPSLYHWAAKKAMPASLVSSLGGRVDHLCQPYLPQNYQRDINGHNVIAGVCTPYSWQVKSEPERAQETAYLHNLYASKPADVTVELGAIVGNAHLEKTDSLRGVLAAHQQASPKFAGIRDMIDWSDDPALAHHAREKNIHKSKAWLQGMEILAEHDLLFDAFVLHHQLHEFSELAKQFPDTTMILSHAGTPVGVMGPYAGYGETPEQRDRILKEWQAGMARLAENPNVVVKLTGLFLAKLGWGLQYRKDAPTATELVDRLQPLVDFVIEQFGVERCMFGSHFAPDRTSISYSQLYDVYKQIIQGRPLEHQQKLLADNARRVYRIKL
ncbi:amidohydrolase family protein [Maricurvus nonylphenolicus]|uniref:amidohydrolase family protein n=1 Tax=Maricurvus nonylphenolicus TaxID=1008307 RepID=UPI0036F3E8D4